MSRQYLSVLFNHGGTMAYTYHNDGEPFLPGDRVLVPGKGGKGTRTVTVHEIRLPKPRFETKAIIGRAPPPPGKLL